MKPALTYTLARFGLLVAVFVALLPLPSLSLLVKALLALLITMPLSWFLLRGMRERTSVAIAEGLRRRKERRERLRAALAGEDEGAEAPREGAAARPGTADSREGAAARPGTADHSEGTAELERERAASPEPGQP